MTRLTGRLTLAVASLAIALTITQIAAAQRGEGRGRGGRDMVSSVELASHEKVEAELNFTDDQKQQIADLREAAREEMRGLRDQEGGDRREAMQKIAQDTAAKLAEVLDDDQEKRLAGILIQVDVISAMNHPYVVEQLALTDDQKTKLDEARQASRRAMRDAVAGAQDQSREERRAKMAELRTTAEKNLTAVLTPEQQTKLEDLKGEPVEINRWELSRGRGEGGRGRRGGDRNQGN